MAAEPSAAQWAGGQRDALAAITAESLAGTLREGPASLEALFAQIKTAGASDPLASVRIAALSQFVMRAEGAGFREAYAAALLAAAQQAREADVACFFLNQLRWCGLPAQAEALRSMEKSSGPGIAGLAAMAIQAVTDDRSSKAAPVPETPGAALNRELAALSPEKRTERLLEVAGGEDVALAGVALRWASSTGGPGETALWTAKLEALQDPARRTMLLDMLAARGDKGAIAAVCACLTDADDAVAGAAQRALLALDQEALAAQAPGLLRSLPPGREALLREGLRQLKNGLLERALLASWESFSTSGKVLALNVLQERRLAAAVPLGLAALDSPDQETVVAGFRLLREIAGPEHAGMLLGRLPGAQGKALAEAQAAVAGAARRDDTGAYSSALLEAMGRAKEEHKAVLFETAARLGGESLRKAIEAASDSSQVDTATAAVRALADWPDPGAVPVLLRVAATGATERQQILAQRGLARQMSQQGADKARARAMWRDLKPRVAVEARRQALDELFKEEVNVALGKAVTTSVPHEGGHVPSLLVDGKPELAWYGAKWPAQAVVDLGEPHALSAARVIFYHQDQRAYTFTLEISEDGQSWKPLGGNTGAPEPATADGVRLSFAPTSGRYARLTVLKNSANPAVHVMELQLFEARLP